MLPDILHISRPWFSMGLPYLVFKDVVSLDKKEGVRHTSSSSIHLLDKQTNFHFNMVFKKFFFCDLFL